MGSTTCGTSPTGPGAVKERQGIRPANPRGAKRRESGADHGAAATRHPDLAAAGPSRSIGQALDSTSRGTRSVGCQWFALMVTWHIGKGCGNGTSLRAAMILQALATSFARGMGGIGGGGGGCS